MRQAHVVRLARSPGTIAFIAFLVIYLALVRYCSYAFYRDPTSAFFDPVRGYDRKYSLERQEQADLFVHNAGRSDFLSAKPKDIKMCVGIATVARDQEQYIRSTIGSLLDGLTPQDREEIFFTVLIAQTTPHDHPIYGEQWFTNVVDQVLLYNVSQEQMADLISWENKKDYRKKAIFDYIYLLQKCEDTGAQWIAIIEDDTLAFSGWYHSTIKALLTVDDQYLATGKNDWLYLRIFFTEEFLGWNSEEWPQYLIGSIGIAVVIAMFLLFIRQFALDIYVTNSLIAVVCLAYTPACISLYFLAGRISMQPLASGVHRMPHFGCCAQGLVFSQLMAPKVIARLAQKGEGFADQLIESWANEANLERWVVIPSLLQHIGGHSSKGDDFGSQAKYERSVAEKIWNFGFEMYDDTTT